MLETSFSSAMSLARKYDSHFCLRDAKTSGVTLPSVRDGLLDELVCSTLATSSGLRDIFTGSAGVARSIEDSSDDDGDGDNGG